jgi:hypothetical protein
MLSGRPPARSRVSRALLHLDGDGDGVLACYALRDGRVLCVERGFAGWAQSRCWWGGAHQLLILVVSCTGCFFIAVYVHGSCSSFHFFLCVQHSSSIRLSVEGDVGWGPTLEQGHVRCCVPCQHTPCVV